MNKAGRKLIENLKNGKPSKDALRTNDLLVAKRLLLNKEKLTPEETELLLERVRNLKRYKNLSTEFQFNLAIVCVAFQIATGEKKDYTEDLLASLETKKDIGSELAYKLAHLQTIYKILNTKTETFQDVVVSDLRFTEKMNCFLLHLKTKGDFNQLEVFETLSDLITQLTTWKPSEVKEKKSFFNIFVFFSLFAQCFPPNAAKAAKNFLPEIRKTLEKDPNYEKALELIRSNNSIYLDEVKSIKTSNFVEEALHRWKVLTSEDPGFDSRPFTNGEIKWNALLSGYRNNKVGLEELEAAVEKSVQKGGKEFLAEKITLLKVSKKKKNKPPKDTDKPVDPQRWVKKRFRKNEEDLHQGKASVQIPAPVVIPKTVTHGNKNLVKNKRNRRRNK